jgi:hypothetical protein
MPLGSFPHRKKSLEQMGLYVGRNGWTLICDQNTSIRARRYLLLKLWLLQGSTRWESNGADFDPNLGTGL